MQEALPVISERFFEWIKNVATRSRGRIDKAIAVGFYIHWLKEEAFVTRLLCIFDQHSGGTIHARRSEK